MVFWGKGWGRCAVLLGFESLPERKKLSESFTPCVWLSWLECWHGGQRTLVGSPGLALRTPPWLRTEPCHFQAPRSSSQNHPGWVFERSKDCGHKAPRMHLVVLLFLGEETKDFLSGACSPKQEIVVCTVTMCLVF